MNGFEYHVLRCGVTSFSTSHLKCSYCGAEYRSKEGLAYHLKATHESANTTKIKPTKVWNLNKVLRFHIFGEDLQFVWNQICVASIWIS